MTFYCQLLLTLCIAMTFWSSTAKSQELLDPDTLNRLVHESVKRDMEQINLERARERATANLIHVVGSLIEKPELMELVELMQDQEVELKEIMGRFQKKKQEIQQNIDSEKLTKHVGQIELAKSKRMFSKEIASIFLDHQLDYFANMNISDVGLPKALTESDAGGIIRLTDKEKSLIRERAEELSKEVRDFIVAARKKAYSKIFDGISDERRELIRKYYGAAFDEYFSSLTMEKLAEGFHFENNKDFLKSLKETPISEIIQQDKN